MKSLGILIPTTPDRKPLLDRLLLELLKQRHETNSEHEVVFLIENTPPHNKQTNEFSTGRKRNSLIQRAIDKEVKYISFFDSDDMPGPTYIQRGIEVANSGMDCAELWGQIYWSGKPGLPFHHYLGCTHAWQDDKQYHRPANHLNFMKLDLIKDFRFEDKTFGEDMTWAMEIQKAGTFKTMYPIPEVIYSYFCGEPKHAL